MVQVPFTMNLYLWCLLHLTKSFLLSSKDIRHFLLSHSRQPMATLTVIPTIFLQIIWRQNLIVQFTPFDYGEKLMHHTSTRHVWSHEVQPHVELFVYILNFVLWRPWDDGKWQDPHSFMYICTCSVLVSSLPLTSYLKNTNENFQKIPFLMLSSHNFQPKRNELRYHCCLSQLYFIWH
jgi:hypothetical protein